MSYPEILLQYAENPPNRGKLPSASVEYFEQNRSCGDTLTIFLMIDATTDTITDFSFEWNAAIVTVACASIVGEVIVGMSCEEILTFDYSFVVELLGTEIAPRRRNASVLGLLGIRNAIHSYRKDGITDDFAEVLPN